MYPPGDEGGGGLITGGAGTGTGLDLGGEADARYRMLFEATPLPMWVYDAETLRFLAVNDAAIRHYGWSCEEFLQMAITDIRPLEDVDALLENLDSGEVGSPLPAVWRHRRQDGTTIDVEISAGKIVFEGRDAALVLARDVTERRRLEERLVEAEKMEAVGRLAGGVAHDFNNLLTVISGYAAILREDLGERIIGDNVRVTVRLAPGPAAVVADRAQVERVVLNLAANARDAMPQGGRLTIETALVDLDDGYVAAHGEVRPGPHVLLAISDTGTGMSEEVRRHLFEPFFTTKAGGGGTGLGLATVFGVVRQSGGSIFVYSEEGRGTTFKIYLPAAGAPQAEEAQPAAEPVAEGGSETIVVVEDDESVRELVRLMLEGRGYEVLTARDGETAARLCTEHRGGVDLLLTDVVMPEVNGRVLAERLEALFPRLRVLFMSGYSDEAVFRHGIIRPNTAFIEKPFSEVSLAAKLREVLDTDRATPR